ncbi:MAG: hypothetical protein KC620_17495, partial [Myxococcales bacterium]|nr:hypothetical protein [Myxococcales bacterium]
PFGQSLCVPARVCIDDDGDHFGAGRGCEDTDCDDANADIFPGAEEVCDGVDNDCDEAIDEGLQNACGGCGPPPVEVCNGVDDDCDARVDEGTRNACGRCGPVPPEVCDTVDNDCDDRIDEDACADVCPEGETRPCYPGDVATRGVGRCADGSELCAGGDWLACADARLPAEETCEGTDEDCDGFVDEGTTNRCGTCGPPPLEVCNEADDDCDGRIDEGITTVCGGCLPCGEALVFPGESGVRDPALAPAPDGGITLGAGAVAYDAIWIPNSEEDTFSRFNTRTGREEGRYFIGENPSRTAVDLNGNAWVATRGDGWAMHVFYNRADCIDRDGDGVIRTSVDLNGDGRITGGEMVGSAEDPLADECVHCRIRLGRPDEWIRGVGVDADNNVWFGGWTSRAIWKVDPNTCEILLELPSRDPIYGLVIDGQGNLYTSNYTYDCLTHVDTRAGEVVRNVCYGATRYGIAVDEQGRVWYGTTGTNVLMFDPRTDEWRSFQSPNNLVRYTAGLVADGHGGIYVTGYDNATIAHLDIATETWTSINVGGVPAGLPRQSTPRGVTLDIEGNVWGICRESSGLIKLTPDLTEVLDSVAIVGAFDPTTSTRPYSYSDNTGFQLFTFTAREGLWRYPFDAGAPVRFVRAVFNTSTPEGTSISVRARAANDEDTLAQTDYTEWVEGINELDLGDMPVPSRYLELQFRLHSDSADVRPVLRDVQVFFVGADCREEGAACPEGQVCDPRTGGCRVVPRDCADDQVCRAGEYCDANGICRGGCRLAPDDCPLGSRCNPDDRSCERRQAECAVDAECPADRYCDQGFCEPGCRLAEDACPPRFTCDAATRQCQPAAPECGIDGDCDADEYCADQGLCALGCRLEADACDTVRLTVDGFVRPWLVTPLLPINGGDIDTNLLANIAPEESALHFSAGLPVGAAGEPIALLDSPTDAIAIGQRLRTVYAMTWIEMPAAADLELGFGSYGPMKAFVGPPDGPLVEIYRSAVSRDNAPDTDRVPVHLEAGLNRIMVKVYTDGFGRPGFHVRLHGADAPYTDANARVRAEICDPQWHTCVPRPPDCDAFFASEETCNGIDDDCDGITDEDFGGGMPCAEGVGACRRDGVMACAAGGALRCSVAAGAPTDETCDGRDEDCDGQIDEGLGLGDACAVGVGLCRREATKTCDDSGGLRCAVSPGEPAVETCDGRDEDCDGRTDEGFDIGASCAAGVGACQAMGTKRCAPDGAATLCDAMPGAPGDEACNGRDDDCDGRADEGC